MLDVRVNVVAEPGLEDIAALVERAARAAAADRGVEDGALSITLLDDPGMASLNRQWLDRDRPTDVLAFALHDAGEPPMGDIYLGVERARAQADDEGEPLIRELARLAVHGTLHVLGLDHPDADREQSEMWRHQERIVATLEVA
jgi:probable rRNA maturation factor